METAQSFLKAASMDDAASMHRALHPSAHQRWPVDDLSEVVRELKLQLHGKCRLELAIDLPAYRVVRDVEHDGITVEMIPIDGEWWVSAVHVADEGAVFSLADFPL